MSGRARKTSAQVYRIDRTAAVLITIGGWGVIVAVLGIFAFLTWETLPLFRGAHVGSSYDLDGAGERDVAYLTADEYRTQYFVVYEDGDWETRWIRDGRVVDSGSLLGEGEEAVAWAFGRQSGSIAAGLADGRVRLGQFEFKTDYLAVAEDDPELGSLEIGASVPRGSAVVDRPVQEQYRSISVVAELADASRVGDSSSAVRTLHYLTSEARELLLTVQEDGTAVLGLVRRTVPLGGGKPRIRVQSVPFELESEGVEGLPRWSFVTADGAFILCIWENGDVQRYFFDRDDDVVRFGEAYRVVEAGEMVSKAEMLLGGKTAMIGTSRGRVLGGFVVPSTETRDGRAFAVAHTSDFGAGEPILTLSSGQRDRSFVAGDAAGNVFIQHMTSRKNLARLSVGDGAAVRSAVVTPRLDGVLALGEGVGLRFWEISAHHPESSVSSLFGKVWYEGGAGPEFVYQSSSADDSAEPKYGVVPLIFGTMKATVYAMIFAVPLAVLGAIYTSEFLHPNVRNRVKPVVEAMASLPSVVLGFVAALIIAPFARDWLGSILVWFFLGPIAVLLGAYLWQIVPSKVATRLTSFQHFVLVCVVVLIGMGVSAGLGTVFERMMFSPRESDLLLLAGSYEAVPQGEVPGWVGDVRSVSDGESRRLRAAGMAVVDGEVVRAVGSASDPEISGYLALEGLEKPSVRRWLDGVIGGAWPGWFMLLAPFAAGIAWFVRARFVDAPLAELFGVSTGLRAGLLELAKFVAVLVLMVALASIGASVLAGAGLDARDSIFGTFNQRNTLVVGIIMGFAIIPIIFTISEDALSSVSNSLRSASLGAGATRWQTAIRVVLPVAASGIFSACTIGLGRATGETMIVLMATGNTPSMDLSIFSGFRTLAANIAVEMPEAPKGHTHYRVLFLCGLVLFAMTFTLNTAAELVRQRFRKRAAAL